MPYEYYATVTNVVDGDTSDVLIDVGFSLTMKARIRFLGINCPEVHGPTKEAGLAAAAYSRSKLLGQKIVIQTQKEDNFDRWLGRIYLNGVDFCLELVTLGYAVPFMVPKTATSITLFPRY